MTFQELVEKELKEARKAFPNINSAHEGYAVILEEVRELETQVFKRPELRSAEAMLKELVQIAAMCQRTAEDYSLLPARTEEYRES